MSSPATSNDASESEARIRFSSLPLAEPVAQAIRRDDVENPPPDAAKVQKLGEEYVQIEGRLAELMEEWEGLHE